MNSLKQSAQKVDASSSDASANKRGHFAERKRVMVRKMLSIGYQMRYDEPRKPSQQHLPPAVVNFANVSAWCQSAKCSVGKPLNQMTGKELSKAITQFEYVLLDFRKKYGR